MKKLNIKLVKKVSIPVRKHKDDAGLDVYSPGDIEVKPGVNKIPLGICLELESKYMGQVVERSSMAVKGLIMAKSPIDAGYRGEIHAIIINTTNETIYYNKNDRIGQLVITKIETPELNIVEKLNSTERGIGGFGSTNDKNRIVSGGGGAIAYDPIGYDTKEVSNETN